MDFVIAAANLRAVNYGLRGCKDRSFFKKVLGTITVSEFTPRTGVNIQVMDGDQPPAASAAAASSTLEEIEEMIEALPPPSSLVGYRMHPVEFEKDDDTNFHVSFVTAAANLRAINYGITPGDSHHIKQIAGKIIPAIATTTAVVAGLVGLELYKLADGCRDIERYKNGFVNLALPFFGFSEPIRAPQQRYGTTEWTLWDRFEVEGDPTLAEFLELFRQKHKLEINMLSHGSSMLYGFIRNREVMEERLKMPITKLVESIGKKPLPPYATSLVLEMLAEDLEGHDIEVPYILVKYRCCCC